MPSVRGAVSSEVAHVESAGHRQLPFGEYRPVAARFELEITACAGRYGEGVTACTATRQDGGGKVYRLRGGAGIEFPLSGQRYGQYGCFLLPVAGDGYFAGEVFAGISGGIGPFPAGNGSGEQYGRCQGGFVHNRIRLRPTGCGSLPVGSVHARRNLRRNGRGGVGACVLSLERVSKIVPCDGKGPEGGDASCRGIVAPLRRLRNAVRKESL